MILSDRDIKAALDSGRLLIEPLQCPEQQIQPGSVDLHLGDRLIVKREINDNGTRRVIDFEHNLATQGPFYLWQGVFVLASTRETVTLPDDLSAQVDGRSSFGRLGLQVHKTAGWIDAGFSGQITLEMSNSSPEPLPLISGMRVCQMVLFPMSSPAERPYGSARGSHYQGQMGPTRARMEEVRR